MRTALLLLALFLVACTGGLPAQPDDPNGPTLSGSETPGDDHPMAANACADHEWGGWDGEAHCAELAHRVVAGGDLGCAVDADCVAIHPGVSCREGAVSASRVDL